MNKISSQLKIDDKIISNYNPVYFIADIAANHDGDLSRAKELIYLAKEAGADAAKFQHFRAETIVSDFGFKQIGTSLSHQSKWKKSVYDVYKDASVNIEWTETLKETCIKAGITFFTSPYDHELVDKIDPYVTAYKIGSGDITWTDIISHIASKGKPYIIASGASTMDDVTRAINAGININPNIALLQCNTNYTGNKSNYKYINLNVLKTYREMYPDMVLGLSDHTQGYVTVLGAVALGAKIIEKHFTDDNKRNGPDHAFSMIPKTWKQMVECTNELEYSLGVGIKKIEENERETVVLQRRAIRINKDIKKGDIVTKKDIILLRPCPEDAMLPFQEYMIIGKKLKNNKNSGDYIKCTDIE
jgi:N-acetylneuraminate synthase